MTPYYQDDNVTIYHGDCRDIIGELDFDVIVSDPPYGINAMAHRRSMPDGVKEFDEIAGDMDLLAVEFLMGQIGDTPAAVFGANNFPHLLPHRGRWIC